MRRVAVAVISLLALAAAPAAWAGGWATVEIDQPLGDPRAGESWTVNVKVLQHGVTPMSDVTPSVRIIGSGGRELDFPAGATETTGTYRAAVRFPSEGRWTLRVFDGFTDVEPHIFPAVTVGPSAIAPTPVADDDGGPPWPQLVAGALIALLALGGWAYGSRPERPQRRRRLPLAG